MSSRTSSRLHCIKLTPDAQRPGWICSELAGVSKKADSVLVWQTAKKAPRASGWSTGAGGTGRRAMAGSSRRGALWCRTGQVPDLRLPPRSSFVVFAFPYSPGVCSSACRGACDLLHWPYLSSAIIAPHTCVHSSKGVASMCFHTHSQLLGNHFILAQVCQHRCRHAGDVHTKGMKHHNLVSVTESGYVCVKIFSKTSA